MKDELKMDILNTGLISAARDSAKAARGRESISPRYINSMVKFVFQLCDAYEQLVIQYESMQSVKNYGEKELIAGNMDAIAYHLEKGIDNGGVPRSALAMQLRNAAKEIRADPLTRETAATGGT